MRASPVSMQSRSFASRLLLGSSHGGGANLPTNRRALAGRAVRLQSSSSARQIRRGPAATQVTVSTVGLVPQLRQLCRQSRAQLAVSLHATTDEVRDWIAPVNRRWKLAELLGCLREFFPRRGGRSVFIEYVMLAGVNDSLADASRLVALLEPLECKVNLIAFNAHPGTRFLPSPQEQVLAFRSVLIAAGRVCTVRASRGDDEMAACGQLGVGEDRLAPMLRVPPQFEGALAPL